MIRLYMYICILLGINSQDDKIVYKVSSLLYSTTAILNCLVLYFAALYNVNIKFLYLGNYLNTY